MKNRIVLFAFLFLATVATLGIFETVPASAQGGKIAISKEATKILEEKRKAFERALMEWEVEKIQVASWYIGLDNKVWGSSQFDESLTHIVPRYKSTEPEDVSLRIGK